MIKGSMEDGGFGLRVARPFLSPFTFPPANASYFLYKTLGFGPPNKYYPTTPDPAT